MSWFNISFVLHKHFRHSISTFFSKIVKTFVLKKMLKQISEYVDRLFKNIDDRYYIISWTGLLIFSGLLDRFTS
jgi:hypothetical protein